MRVKKQSDKKEKVQRVKIATIKKRIRPVGSTGKFTALIYGRSGTGKTVFASTLAERYQKAGMGAKVLLIDCNEEGEDSISNMGDIVDVIMVSTWEEFEAVYRYLESGEHPYGGAIVDTGTQLQDIAMVNARKVGQAKDMMTRRSWGVLSTTLAPRLLDFRNLPIDLIILAQDRRDQNDADVEDEDDLLPEFGPGFMPSVAKVVSAMVKVIGQTYVTEKEITKGKKKGKLEPQFRMRLGPHPLYLTKIRVPKGNNVPRSIPNPTVEKIQEYMEGK